MKTSELNDYILTVSDSIICLSLKILVIRSYLKFIKNLGVLSLVTISEGTWNNLGGYTQSTWQTCSVSF